MKRFAMALVALAFVCLSDVQASAECSGGVCGVGRAAVSKSRTLVRRVGGFGKKAAGRVLGR